MSRPIHQILNEKNWVLVRSHIKFDNSKFAQIKGHN